MLFHRNNDLLFVEKKTNQLNVAGINLRITRHLEDSHVRLVLNDQHFSEGEDEY